MRVPVSPNLQPKKVDLIAPPFSGHLYPLIALGKRLRQRGDQVRFITGMGKAPLLRELGFDVQIVCAHDPDAMERIANTPYPVKGNPFRLYWQLRDNLALCQTISKELRHFFAARRPDIVVADFCAPIAGRVCDMLDIPWITTIPTPFALESTDGTPSYLGGWGQAQHWGHALRNRVGRWATRAAKKTFAKVLAQPLRELGLSIYRPDGSETAYSPYAILGLGMNELEFPRQWPAPFRMVGPLVESPEEKPITPAFQEIGKHKAILVTLGTHLLWAKQNLLKQLHPLLTAFPDHWFIISLGDALHQAVEPLERGDHWSLYSYVPYDTSLSRFEAVIHHGGAGILYSCIQHKKPSLICPYDYDQFDFAQRAHERHVGIRVRTLTSETAINGLKKLLNGHGYVEREKMAQDFSRYQPYEACLKEIDQWTNRKEKA